LGAWGIEKKPAMKNAPSGSFAPPSSKLQKGRG